MEDLTIDGNNLYCQAPQWSNQFELQTFQGTGPTVGPLNGLSSTHLAHGGAIGALANANFNSYMPSSQYGLTTPSMDSLAPWAHPFGGSQFDGSMMQYNPLSMTPTFGTFINQNEPPLSAYHPPANQVSWHSSSLDHGQMGCLPLNPVSPGLTAGQMPMGNMLGYHGALPVNMGISTFAPGVLNDNEAYTQPLTGFMDYNSLSEDSNSVDPYSPVFPGQAD